ncbi:DUF7931 domain-containing protein [Pseudoduganella sp. RAF53_2]|uniref:DUF7931 domain-containing protein n=1 Tax=unclassified Pseudoduganella TaxID=2637179 RepID=UPI003F99A968
MEKHPFDSRTQFEALLMDCFSRARLTLRMFDPDYAWWKLGHSQTDAVLRKFLHGGGRLLLVAHSNAQLQRYAPRFLTLLQDYSHRIECRLTSKSLKQLTDSFAVADEIHIVRRFHSDHFRGEANFDDPSSTQTSLERFEGIWAETLPGLQADATGL